MEKFIEKLQEVQTLSESVGKYELGKLATKLADDYECKKELENNLLFFFSLNSSDLELVLKLIRRVPVEIEKEDKVGNKFLRKNERLISSMVKSLNRYSIKKTGKPFHLSAVLGELEITEKMANSFKLNVVELSENEKQTSLKAKALGGCPQGYYPRYVGKKLPWKLGLSFRTRTYRRKEDAGCHFQHGPFRGTIKGWVSFNIRVVLMVLFQGWGGNLAANNKHFFYKWWFVIMLGLTPYSCQWLLYARRY